METVADPELEMALAGLDVALDRLFEAGVDPQNSKDAIAVIERMERIARRVSAANVDVLAAVDRDGLYHLDGHFSAKVMVRHVAKVSNGEAAGRASVARALRDLPGLSGVWHSGDVGSCQVRRLARVYANKRVRDRLIEDEHKFIDLAGERSFKDFDLRVTDWVRLVDEDGTADKCKADHENRDAKIVQDFDLGWLFNARCGSLQGAQIEMILSKFIEAEFLTDWENAKELYGGDVNKDLLARSDAQRRFDAFFEIFMRAATKHGPGARPAVVTNIVLDQATFERELRRLAGQDPGPGDPWDPTYRCATLNGRPIQHTEAIAAALLGKIKRVVINAASVRINMSRDTRLFTGNARLAVQLGHIDCNWTGCQVPGTDCQIDHSTPWAKQPDGTGGGCTCPENGAPLCPKHNRMKQQGYTTWRDPQGKWHTYRPDGTEIK